MRYAINRNDGGVSIMVMVPLSYSIGGKRKTIVRVRDDKLVTEDGEISIPCPLHELTPTSIAGLTLEFPTPEDEVAKHPEAERAKVVSIRLLGNNDVPPDRTFRDAWTHDGKTIVHDMVKAKSILREALRRQRECMFAALDVDYQRADERGDAAAKAAVAQRKQKLRDVTKNPLIDAAASVDDLKALTIDKLAA
jgi:hypothetical protein